MAVTEELTAPPVLDFSVFYSNDPVAKQHLVDEVRRCCLRNGFFQITGHRIPFELQQKAFKHSETFFSQPLDEKNKVSMTLNTWNRGYDRLRSQILEAGTAPDLKESFYIGADISTSHPFFKQKKLNSGPNSWPDTVSSPEDFKKDLMAYYGYCYQLAQDVLRVIALSLTLEETYFDEYAKDAVATMRLLHYPPSPPDAEETLTRGVGAHTDFGGLTLLLQGEVAGLQVLENRTGQWIDVRPVKGAYVVNLGNLMQIWSNDKYKSNIHRVINKSGGDRYSIPFFFSGNPDYVVSCLPNCSTESEPPKYKSVTVEEMVNAGYQKSYGLKP